MLLGMLTPSSNSVLEPVSSAKVAVAPEISVHFGRFRVTEIALNERALAQFDSGPRLEEAGLLADARVKAICWNGMSARHGIQVNGHLSWRISSRNFGSQPAHFRRVLTLPLALLARTRPRAKRLTTAMFLAPWPVR